MDKKTFAQYRHRERNFLRLMSHLKDNPCVDCGENNPVVLDFDHSPSLAKSFDIGRAIRSSGRSWESIYKEMQKCDVVCSNCHRLRSAKRNNDRRYRFWTGSYVFPEEFVINNDTRFRVPHGGGAKGRRGCKCEPCKERYRQYHRELRKK